MKNILNWYPPKWDVNFIRSVPPKTDPSWIFLNIPLEGASETLGFYLQSNFLLENGPIFGSSSCSHCPGGRDGHRRESGSESSGRGQAPWRPPSLTWLSAVPWCWFCGIAGGYHSDPVSMRLIPLRVWVWALSPIVAEWRGVLCSIPHSRKLHITVTPQGIQWQENTNH